MTGAPPAPTRAGEAGLYVGGDLLGRLLSWWRTRVVLKHVSGRLIDIACGDNRLVRAYGSGQGIDIDPRGQPDVLACPDFTRLPIADGAADSVTVIASLNYFPDAVGVLREIARILAADGRLLITMPNARVMQIWHRFREPWAHKAGYDEAELLALTRDAGFVLSGKYRFMWGVNRLYVMRKQQEGS